MDCLANWHEFVWKPVGSFCLCCKGKSQLDVKCGGSCFDLVHLQIFNIKVC